MLKKTIDRAECEVDIDWFLEGSVLAGTVHSGARGCRTRLIVDSPEPEADVMRIVRLAEAGCFAEQLVSHEVPLTSSYLINGEERE